VTEQRDAQSGLALADAARFARMALDSIVREYPSKILHVLASDADALPPRRLTPAFFGAYDWHSAVHGHWSLVRLLRLFPDAAFADEVQSALDLSLTPEKVAAELAYLGRPERAGFEVPYGMAWLLCLARELGEWSDARATGWRDVLEPLERFAAERVERWLARLPHPVRTGEHTQSAFGLSLFLDWLESAGEKQRWERVAERVRKLHDADRDAPLHLEPSGFDFLSPSLGAADLMRRVRDSAAFASWLSRSLPGIPDDGNPDFLLPAVCPDPSDAKLSHLDGLNLSRAWMLDGMLGALPQNDARRAALRGAADRHRELGLRAVTGAHYAGSHWQGTFAIYLSTERNAAGGGLD
jgi:Protein of unknown function (DUF2891)